MSAVSEPSPKLGGGYEIVNALGRMNADRPKLATACVEKVTLAKVARLVLHVFDLHAQQTARTPERIAHDLATGQIEVRYEEGSILLLMDP